MRTSPATMECSTTALIMPPIQPLPTEPNARWMDAGEVALGQQPGPNGIQRVVRQVGDPIGVADAHRLLGRRRRLDAPGMGTDPIAHLPAQVEVLEHLEDAHALRRVVPATARREVRRQGVLAGVPEGRVADVVAQRDRLGEGLVEGQRGGQGARDLGHLEGVRQAGDVVVAFGVDEHLRLVLQPPERLGVEDAVAVPLERGAVAVRRLRSGPPAGLDDPDGCGRQSAELLRLAGLAGAQDEGSTGGSGWWGMSGDSLGRAEGCRSRRTPRRGGASGRRSPGRRRGGCRPGPR